MAQQNNQPVHSTALYAGITDDNFDDDAPSGDYVYFGGKWKTAPDGVSVCDGAADYTVRLLRSKTMLGFNKSAKRPAEQLIVEAEVIEINEVFEGEYESKAGSKVRLGDPLKVGTVGTYMLTEGVRNTTSQDLKREFNNLLRCVRKGLPSEALGADAPMSVADMAAALGSPDNNDFEGVLLRVRVYPKTKKFTESTHPSGKMFVDAEIKPIPSDEQTIILEKAIHDREGILMKALPEKVLRDLQIID